MELIETPCKVGDLGTKAHGEKTRKQTLTFFSLYIDSRERKINLKDYFLTVFKTSSNTAKEK